MGKHRGVTLNSRGSGGGSTRNVPKKDIIGGYKIGRFNWTITLGMRYAMLKQVAKKEVREVKTKASQNLPTESEQKM